VSEIAIAGQLTTAYDLTYEGRLRVQTKYLRFFELRKGRSQLQLNQFQVCNLVVVQPWLGLTENCDYWIKETILEEHSTLKFLILKIESKIKNINLFNA
jgi:hypothetical protein